MHEEGQEGSFQKAGHWQSSAFKEKADLLWGVDGEKWELSKAKEASIGGSDIPMFPCGNNRCPKLGIPTGTCSYTLTMGQGTGHCVI